MSHTEDVKIRRSNVSFRGVHHHVSSRVGVVHPSRAALFPLLTSGGFDRSSEDLPILLDDLLVIDQVKVDLFLKDAPFTLLCGGTLLALR